VCTAGLGRSGALTALGFPPLPHPRAPAGAQAETLYARAKEAAAAQEAAIAAAAADQQAAAAQQALQAAAAGQPPAGEGTENDLNCGLATVAAGAGAVGAVSVLSTAACLTAGWFTFGAACTPLAIIAGAAAAGGVAGLACAKAATDGEGCFPADARVLLANGTAARMDALALGDFVAVAGAGGGVSFSPVYGWGHQQERGVSSFVSISVGNASLQRTLELTPDHFVLVGSGGEPSPAAAHQRRAGSVRVGDTMFQQLPGSQQLVGAQVLSVQRVDKVSHRCASCCCRLLLPPAAAGCCLLLPAAACCCLLLPAAACCCLLLPAAACCCLLLPAAAMTLVQPSPDFPLLPCPPALH